MTVFGILKDVNCTEMKSSKINQNKFYDNSYIWFCQCSESPSEAAVVGFCQGSTRQTAKVRFTLFVILTGSLLATFLIYILFPDPDIALLILVSAVLTLMLQ